MWTDENTVCDGSAVGRQTDRQTDGRTDGRRVSISVGCTCSGRGWWCVSMLVPTDVGGTVWRVAWPAFDGDGSARETIHSSWWYSGLHRVACVAVCVCALMALPSVGSFHTYFPHIRLGVAGATRTLLCGVYAFGVHS